MESKPSHHSEGKFAVISGIRGQGARADRGSAFHGPRVLKAPCATTSSVTRDVFKT